MEHTTERRPGNGLTLHVHRFRGPSTTHRLLVLHGFMDGGGSWSDVAVGLCARGIEVIAPDLRGFGASDWVSGGGYYHFADYVADVDALVRALALESLIVAGHSMGGTVACYVAGARPALVSKLILLEGIGPPDMDPSVTLPRTRSWLDALAKPRTNKPLASLADAARRLGTTFSDIDHATLLRVARHLVVERDGELQWGFDPLHRSTSPARFDVRSFMSFLEAVDCPTLFIDGGERGLHPADERERIAKVRQGQQLTLPNAGHMMHWTQPDAVSSAIADFVQA